MSITLLGSLSRLDAPRYRAELYRAWVTASSAGLSHTQALEGLGQSGSAETEEARRYLLVGVQQERSIASLVRARPNLFDPFEGAVLTAGEENDALPNALRLLADVFSREYKRMLSIRLLMGYPIFIGVALTFVVAIPMLHRGWRTYMVFVGIAFIALMMLGGLVLGFIAGAMSAGVKMTRARFARALVVALETGIPLGRAIRLAVDASGSPVLKAQIASRSERDLNTTPLAKMFEGCREVPPAMLTAMSVADATGDYLHTLKRYADQLEEK